MATPFEAVEYGELPFARLHIEGERESGPGLDELAYLGDLAFRKVVILGIPGSGKTTLVETLKESNPDINYLSLGAISRGLDPESPQRRALDELFAIGKPVGDAGLFLDILEPHLDRALERGGYILDGMPKKVAEIDPLLQFLERKAASPDAIISCSVSPIEAHRRTMDRASRPSDPDTINIFLNRTKVYLRDLDNFERKLAHEPKRPLVHIDTEKTSPQTAARAVELLTNRGEQVELGKGDKPEADILSSAAGLLHEALTSGDKEKALNIYGQLFDDCLPGINHGKASSEEFKDHRQAYVEMALVVQDPKLRETPRFLERFAQNYIDTTLMSLTHLHESMAEEVVLRHGQNFDVTHVEDILSQQYGLKKLIDHLQERIVEGRDLATLVEKEISANLDELHHVDGVLKRRSEALGLEAPASAKELMWRQPSLWGQLTSNQTLISPDYNYRSEANGLPDAHHSLLPFTKNRRAMNANSMGDYIPFVEAVSATENAFTSTFGFIHFIGMDKDGQAFGVEYPIMMHDRRLLNLNNPTINKILIMGEAFYGNHDMWHNLLPVFSKSFILHHPDAPLSHGGRLAPYIEFGNALRDEKEEYEIGVAMAHARTQQERFEDNPELEKQQSELILGALRDLKTVPDQLSGQCSEEETAQIIDYLASMLATKAYNVFPDHHPIYEPIEALLTELKVKPMPISSSEVAELLHRQGLLDTGRLARSENLSKDKITTLIHEDPAFASRLISDYIDPESDDRESGAEHIVSALDRWGVLQTLSAEPLAILGPLEKSRWLAMTAPQRPQLKGHMEKVHGKPGYMFGGELVSDPRDLVLMQGEVLAVDAPEYEYRVEVRKENQVLGYKLYSLLFDDDQDSERIGREELTLLRRSSDTGQKLFAKDAVGMLDELLHDLVRNAYDIDYEKLAYIEAYAASLEVTHASTVLQGTLLDIVSRYRALSGREREHQLLLGVSYRDAAKAIDDEHMDIA